MYRIVNDLWKVLITDFNLFELGCIILKVALIMIMSTSFIGIFITTKLLLWNNPNFSSFLCLGFACWVFGGIYEAIND